MDEILLHESVLAEYEAKEYDLNQKVLGVTDVLVCISDKTQIDFFVLFKSISIHAHSVVNHKVFEALFDAMRDLALRLSGYDVTLEEFRLLQELAHEKRMLIMEFYQAMEPAHTFLVEYLKQNDLSDLD